jgi:6-phosphogluconolactonase
LTLVDCESIRGAHPRNIEVSPNGKWLLAAGRDSNTIAVFRVDAKTGMLAFADKVVNTPAPICVVMQAMP